MKKLAIITGTRKGIGNHLAKFFIDKGYYVVGCSRKPFDEKLDNYHHFEIDIGDEKAVIKMFKEIRNLWGKLDVLINNAGIASMNHSLLTPGSSAKKILSTNILGTFLFCREAAKLMKKSPYGRIINFSTVAVPLKLEGEAIYAASKSAVISLTHVLSKEFAPFKITVNAVGPTPIRTDLIKSIPEEKLKHLIEKQTITRFGTYKDIENVIDFFISKKSDFITGQTIYLGGI